MSPRYLCPNDHLAADDGFPCERCEVSDEEHAADQEARR